MNKYLSALFIFIIFLGIYYMGSFTRIPFADCVGFVLTAEKEDWIPTADATSHFLYNNTVIFIKLLTGLSAINASKFLVVTSGAATVAIAYLTLKSLTKTEWIAITASVVFGFSFSFWRNAEIVEVYTYNTFWVSLFFFSMIKVFAENKNRYIILSGLFLGISLWVHIQNILLIPAFIIFLFNFRHHKKFFYTSLIIFAVLFSSLFIVNMLQGLPFNSPYSSPQGAWVENSFKKTTLQYIKDFFVSLAYLILNFNLFVIFGIAGVILLYKSHRKMFYVFFTGAVCVYGFSTFYAVSDNYVFFLPFNLIFALSIGYGLSSVQYTGFRKFSWICILIPAGYILLYNIVLLTPKGREFNDFKSYKGGLSYYLLPWMNNNAGIMEFTIDKKAAPEPIQWMTVSAEEYIKVLRSKGYTDEQIRKL